MAHWVDTYPHDVYASVLLLDGKIYNWKVGQRYWKTPFDMTWKFPVPEDFNRMTVEHTSWIAENDKEHNTVFQEFATEWFKQWELHEDYVGSNPY